ncbi:hypothetical protein MMC10_006452 [Thelotrema lepadinum]|nr:hypothetical protein [Thelotrema lepadinum]
MREERTWNRQQRSEQNHASGAWRASIQREVTICAAKKRRGYLEHKQEEPEWVLYLNLLAATSSYALLIYGTMLFSSLFLIGPTDAFVAIYRYLGSTLVCRGILVYELSGIMAVETGDQAFDASSPGRGIHSHKGAPTFSTGDTVMSSDDVKQSNSTVVVRKTSD